jgi:hypothetical protein
MSKSPLKKLEEGNPKRTMKDVTKGYEEFAKKHEVDENQKGLFDKTLKEASKPVVRRSKRS